MTDTSGCAISMKDCRERDEHRVEDEERRTHRVPRAEVYPGDFLCLRGFEDTLPRDGARQKPLQGLHRRGRKRRARQEHDEPSRSVILR